MGADRRRRINVIYGGGFWPRYAACIYGLFKSYQGWSNGDNTASILCVITAITALLDTFLLIDWAIIWVGNVAERRFTNGGWKRDNEVQGLLDDFSVELGVEVRHLGFWNDTGASGIPNLKSSVLMEGDNRRPVLGARIHGFDFYFTHRGEIGGQRLMRFSLDGHNGTESEELRER